MQILNKIISIVSGSLICLSLTDCSSVDDEINSLLKTVEDGEWVTCDLIYTDSAPSFDSNESRAGESHEWSDGSIIYISFEKSDGTLTVGNAVYTKSTNSWKLNYDGRLSTDGEYSCHVFYFEGTGFSLNALKTVVTTNYNTAIYAANGSYTYVNGTVNLIAWLSPYTSRIKFNEQGTTSGSYSLRGIDYICEIDLANREYWYIESGDFIQCESGITFKSSTGSSPQYIYGYIHKGNQDNGIGGLKIKSGDYVYTYDFPQNSSDFMKVGTSGYMTMPTVDSHSGWYISDYVSKEITRWSTYTSYPSTHNNNHKDYEFNVTTESFFYTYYSAIYSPKYTDTSSWFGCEVYDKENSKYKYYDYWYGSDYEILSSSGYGSKIILEPGSYDLHFEAEYWDVIGYAMLRNF